MKKRIVSLLLAVCLCLTLLPTVALAAEGDYVITVCGTTVTGTGYVTGTGISGGDEAVHYDSSTHTLTLNGATLTGSITATIPYEATLTIHLVGTNKITSSEDKGISVGYNGDSYLLDHPKSTLRFSSSNNGTLTIEQSGTSTENRYGVSFQTGKINIDSGTTLNVTGGTASWRSYGIYCKDGQLTVAAGANLTATGGAVNGGQQNGAIGYGIMAQTVTVNGQVTATGGKAETACKEVTAQSCGLYSFGLSVDAGGSLTATGGNAESTGKSSKYAYTHAESYGIYVYGGITVKGAITATSGAATCSNGCAYSHGVFGTSDVNVSGTLKTDAGSATSDANNDVRCYGLSANGRVTVKTGGTLTANQSAAAAQPKDTTAAQTADAQSCTSGDASGQDAMCAGVFTQSGLTVDAGGTVTAYGGSVKGKDGSGNPYSYGIYVANSDNADATINGTVTAVGGAASGANQTFSRGFAMKGGTNKNVSLTVGATGSLTATGGETTATTNPCSSGIVIERGKPTVTLKGGTLTAQAAAQTAEDGTQTEVIPNEDATITRAAGTVTEPNIQNVGLIIPAGVTSAVVDIQSGTAKLLGRDCGLYVDSGEVKVGVGSTDGVKLHAKATGTGGKAIYVGGDLTKADDVLLVTPPGGSIYTGTTEGYESKKYSTILNADESMTAEALLRRAAPTPPEDETGDSLPGWLAPILGALDREPFDDVTTRDWFYDAVHYANDYGLMTGTGYRTFSPNAPVTRGMVMTILARREGIRTDRYSPWYAAGVEWAVANGISDGTNPEADITREELATMLYRYASLKGYDLSGAALTGFTDANSVSSYAAPTMQWAVGAGLMSGAAGVDAGKLLPQQTATRAQLAAILHRFFG